MTTTIRSPQQGSSEAAVRRLEEVMDAYRCPRCGGLMIAEQSFGQQSFGLMDEAPAEVPARRCVQCGEIIDLVILKNRRDSLAAIKKG